MNKTLLKNIEVIEQKEEIINIKNLLESEINVDEIENELSVKLKIPKMGYDLLLQYCKPQYTNVVLYYQNARNVDGLSQYKYNISK